MSPEQNNAPLLDNLPVLTEVVGQNTLDDLPTLTEVVSAQEPAMPTEWIDTITLSEPCPAEAAARDESAAHIDPLPPSETVIEPRHSITAALPPPAPPQGISEEHLQQVLNKLQHRLEGKLMQQLAPQIAKLQQQALEQALSELKAEIPALLRNALNLNDSNK